jgi:RNA polymerase sigma-70 factor, ECF subfamily
MTPQSNDPTQIVGQARLGEPEAIGALYARFAPALMRLAHGILNSTQDSEDVLHDVFLGLPEALRHYQEQASLESWLKRITARVALTRLRTDRRRREVGLEHGVTALAAIQPSDAAFVERAIAELPDALRVVFALKSVEGYTHAEIATLLGISVGASEIRLHRAIKLLRTRLTAQRVQP